MKIELGERTAETVKIYFAQAGQQIIKDTLPQKAKTVEEALEDYQASLHPNAASYGRTIIADGNYIGDMWCYCIDKNESPNAMLSYCIFDSSYWKKGIATKAVSVFLDDIKEKYKLKTVGAFTFSDNLASIKVLERNGFSLAEEFEENGRMSQFLQREF